MKTFTFIKTIFCVAMASLLFSCMGEREVPQAPDTALQANITIADLIKKYGKINYIDIDTALYIEGVVVGNDVSGNIYKKIYLQDATAGIDIEIEMLSNCHKYPVGQRLVISLKGLAMGLYGGQPQIAGQGNGVVQRLYEPECDQHFFRKGYASSANMPQPEVTTINKMSFTPDRFVGKLVRLDNVHFADPGSTFATAGDPGNGTNRDLLDAAGNKLVTRNSTKALFANDLIPSGEGSVIGIVGIYNGTLQFYFRSKDDIIGFAGFSEQTPSNR